MPRPQSLRTHLRGLSLACLLVATLGACAPMPWQRFKAGDDVSQVTASLGQPKESYPLGNGVQRLLWPTQPFGEITTAADVDSNGRVLRVAQVLDNNEFAQAEIGKWTREDVLHHFGRPVETNYFTLMKREAWTYRYMDSDVWYMMYTFLFDDNGVLRSTQKSPDPLHDPDRRNFFD